MTTMQVSTEIEKEDAIRAMLRQFAPQADLARIPSNQDLRNALGLDMCVYQSFLIQLAREFGVELAPEDYAQLTTLSDLEYYFAVRSG